MPSAVVTGSSSGIGLATATALVEHGYSVVLHCHQSLGKLESAAGELRKHLSPAAELRCITTDLACHTSSSRFVQACFHWCPNLDLWVNNAGADVLTGSMRERSFEQKLKRLWEVDVVGTIRLCRLVAQRMAVREASPTAPCIINIGWDQALLGMEGEPGQLFCPTKAAVTAFTSAFSLSVAPQIRVNAVAPGWIKTAWGMQSAGQTWNHRAIQESQLQRWGTPQDVANVICWLASPAASFVNGQTIAVNGGRRFWSPPS